MQVSKVALHEHCVQLLNGRIAELETAAEAVREARNNETKSSAGDKYETGRAMMQQEEDKLLARLGAAQQMRLQLRQLDPKVSDTKISPGSMVQTNARIYYLSVSLGKVMYDNKPYFCVSAEAPISRVLLGKAAGESIELNGRKERILALY